MGAVKTHSTYCLMLEWGREPSLHVLFFLSICSCHFINKAWKQSQWCCAWTQCDIYGVLAINTLMVYTKVLHPYDSLLPIWIIRINLGYGMLKLGTHQLFYIQTLDLIARGRHILTLHPWSKLYDVEDSCFKIILNLFGLLLLNPHNCQKGYTSIVPGPSMKLHANDLGVSCYWPWSWPVVALGCWNNHRAAVCSSTSEWSGSSKRPRYHGYINI